MNEVLQRLSGLSFTKWHASYLGAKSYLNTLWNGMLLYRPSFNVQFNTTIDGYSVQFHGIEGTRDMLLMNPDDMENAGLHKAERLQLIMDLDDGVCPV